MITTLVNLLFKLFRAWDRRGQHYYQVEEAKPVQIERKKVAW